LPPPSYRPSRATHDVRSEQIVPPPPPPPAVSQAEFPESVDFEQSLRDFRAQWLEAGERAYVSRLLERHSGSVSAAAEEAQVHRSYIYRLIRRHNP